MNNRYVEKFYPSGRIGVVMACQTSKGIVNIGLHTDELIITVHEYGKGPHGVMRKTLQLRQGSMDPRFGIVKRKRVTNH